MAVKRKSSSQRKNAVHRSGRHGYEAEERVHSTRTRRRKFSGWPLVFMAVLTLIYFIIFTKVMKILLG